MGLSMVLISRFCSAGIFDCLYPLYLTFLVTIHSQRLVDSGMNTNVVIRGEIQTLAESMVEEREEMITSNGVVVSGQFMHAHFLHSPASFPLSMNNSLFLSNLSVTNHNLTAERVVRPGYGRLVRSRIFVSLLFFPRDFRVLPVFLESESFLCRFCSPRSSVVLHHLQWPVHQQLVLRHIENDAWTMKFSYHSHSYRRSFWPLKRLNIVPKIMNGLMGTGEKSNILLCSSVLLWWICQELPGQDLWKEHHTRKAELGVSLVKSGASTRPGRIIQE